MRRLALWRGLPLAIVLVAGCGPDLPAAEVAKTTAATLTCYERVVQAMRGAVGCQAKLAAANLVAQTEPSCKAADMIDLGLVCRDGGTHD